jgi:hypothetical protein
MYIPGYDQDPMPDMQDDSEGMGADEDQNQDQQQGQGDGLHHHQIDEDEGGGYHSVHTFPDGRQDEADHVDYNEAKSKQDSDFGCVAGDGDGDGATMTDDDPDLGDEGDASPNLAASYGQKAGQ